MKKEILSKNNLKTKIISVFAAIALWMYVIAVVDPEEKKVVENIPITITNSTEIQREGLVVSPNTTMRTDITVEGKLSEIQKLNKNNIHIYGDVVNPVEGKNIVTLRTNISNRVSRELKDSSFVVNLEKNKEKTVDVKIDLPAGLEGEVDKIEYDTKSVLIKGAESLVDKVSYVGATINSDKKENIDEEDVELSLVAYTKDGAPVDINWEKKKIKVHVYYTVTKELPIKINYNGGKYNMNSFNVIPEKITVFGNTKTLKNIDAIYTNLLSDDDLDITESKKVKINVPDSIKVKGDITEIELIKTAN